MRNNIIFQRTSPKTQTEIITHFPWEILRKMEIFIIEKQANAQNLLLKMTLHFSLGDGAFEGTTEIVHYNRIHYKRSRLYTSIHNYASDGRSFSFHNFKVRG